ncbi:hypothetical protein ACFL3C_03960 [Patescibacteria group bacterium]
MNAVEHGASDSEHGTKPDMPSLKFVENLEKLLRGGSAERFIEERDGRFFLTGYIAEELGLMYLRACRAETKLRAIDTLEATEALPKVSAIVELIESLPLGYPSREKLLEALNSFAN